MENRNLAHVIYEQIRNDIIELKLEPGSFLLERDISEQLGVSRTPVREAIKRLTQEGWLIAAERRRPVVKGFSLQEGEALFQFRNMAESFSLSWAFENGKAKALAGQLDLQFQKMLAIKDNSIPYIRADIQFHTTIVNCVGNEYLSRSWQTVGDEIIRVAIYGMDYARTIETIIHEHETLMQKIWDNQKDEALRMLHSHHDMVYAGLERQLAQFTKNQTE